MALVTDQTLAFIERQFVDPAPPDKRDGIRDEALREAAGAESKSPLPEA